MDSTMRSIIKHIADNLSTFGLSSTAELKVVESPKSQLTDGGKWLTLLALQTIPDTTRGAPFVIPDVSERALTLIELECKMRSPEPSKDFLWNELWKFRDKVYAALTGTGEGVVITRYDWTNPLNPMEDGQIWFEVNPSSGTPMEKHIEDPNDPANKSVFLTYNVHWWKSSTETVANDPWLEALSTWTATILGDGWTVYRNAYPLNFRKPCVLWRITGADVQEKARALYEVQKRFSGHVLGRTPNEQLSGALTLAQELGSAIKLVYDVTDRRYLTVKNPAVNLQADALSVGQVTVTLSRKTNRPTDDIPYIMHIDGSGNLS